VVFNPKDTADQLKKHGGFIPGIRPGQRTAEFLPEALISQAAIPFYFGGTSLLIVVNVTMDTVQQIQGHLLAHQYEGMIRKAKLGGKRR
jgi:preprotein translocase subunit SecY